MRTTFAAFAFSALTLTSACDVDPCGREAKAAFIGLGGPIGIVIAALHQCSDADPTTPPTLVAEATPVPEPTPEIVAAMPDMAATPPDLAVAPPDMASPPRPVDMATRPPDLAPACPRRLDAQLGSAWATANLNQVGGVFQARAGYNFAAGRAVEGAFDMPLSLRDVFPNDATCLARATEIGVSWTITAQPLTWAATNCTAGGAGYSVTAGTSRTCVLGRYVAGVMVDGVLADSPKPQGNMPTAITASPPAGNYVPVALQQRIALHLGLVGDVALANAPTATLSLDLRY